MEISYSGMAIILGKNLDFEFTLLNKQENANFGGFFTQDYGHTT